MALRDEVTPNLERRSRNFAGFPHISSLCSDVARRREERKKVLRKQLRVAECGNKIFGFVYKRKANNFPLEQQNSTCFQWSLHQYQGEKEERVYSILGLAPITTFSCTHCTGALPGEPVGTSR